MAEVKNSFLSARMNKDLDDRLIPNGEYRDALNIQVGKSESSDVGTVQPIWGNAIPNGYPIEPDDTVKCIGSFMDEKNNRIYQFLTNYFDPSQVIMDPMPEGYINKITMFDLTTLDYRVLVSGTFLNLATNPEFSITGLNLLENLLFWTDNRNQPRKINVEFAINNPLYYTDEVQISVAKYAPLETIEMYRKFIKVASAPNVNNIISLDNVDGITKGMQLVSSAINGSDFAIVVDVDIINNQVTLYETVDGPFASGKIITGDKVTFLASTMSDRSEVSDWPGDPDFFRDKYVRFSYRYKFDDGEYSLMAPFTQIAYIPNQKGYFINGDENEAYRSTVVNWVENNVNNIELLIPFPDQINKVSNSYKITELDVLYKESDSLVVKVIETLKVNDIIPLPTDPDPLTNIYTFPYQSQKPYKALTEDQTIRVYDRVPVRARAQETVSNRVVYGNFRDRYFFENNINYNTAARPKSDVFTNFIEYPNHTLKQNRTYQVGFVLTDKFGRQSSVILSEVDLSTITSGDTVFGGSTVYAPFINEDDLLFPGTKKWFGNALSMVINAPLNSNRSILLGQAGLYANPISPLGFAIRSSNIYVDSLTGNYIYEFDLDSGTWPTNIIIPSDGEYLRGKYKDYIKIINVTETIPGSYKITTKEPINDLYNYNPEFSTLVPDIKYSYTINEIGWYSYKIVVRQQEQAYYNVYLPGLLNGYPIFQTYGSQLTYSDSDGIELATVATNPGTGWTGTSFATGYTHAPNNTGLLQQNLSAIPGSYYSIQYNITSGSGTVGNTTISFGGSTLGSLLSTGSTYIRASTTDILTITPDSNFSGTITLSLKLANGSSPVNENGINTTSFPVGETNKIAHAVLINDNINKIPRDLSEVGPDQKQYRSSVNLFGRVQNKSNHKGNIIGEEPEYDSETNTIKYNSSNPNQGTAWQTVKVGDSIQCVEANEPISISPPLPNPNRWYANTVVTSNIYDPTTGEGIITFTPSNIILKGINGIGSYVTFPVSSATNEQYFPTTRADIATSIANAIDFSFLDNSLENVLGSAGANFYQLQTNPIISRISTKAGIGVEANDIMLPFLAVYETKGEESLLDIFWESATTGYISDLNWDVLTGFEGTVDITPIDGVFYEDQYDGGEDDTGGPLSPYISNAFTALNNQDVPITNTTATMVVTSSTGDVTSFFELEDYYTPNSPLNPGEYRIKIKTNPITGAPVNAFVFNNGDPQNEIYTFTIELSYDNFRFSTTKEIPLLNAKPIIGDGSGALSYNIGTTSTYVGTLTGVNGAYSSSVNQSELYWEIVQNGDDYNKFVINNSTGELTVANGVLLQENDFYEITVRLIDATLLGPIYETTNGPISDSDRGDTSLYTVAKVTIGVLTSSVNPEIKPYITENNFLYNQINENGTCRSETTPTNTGYVIRFADNASEQTLVKYGVVYVGKEPLLNNTSDKVLTNNSAVLQLPPTLFSTQADASYNFVYPTFSNARQYQNFVNIETAVNIQNGANPLNLPPTVGHKKGTLRWTIALGGITDDQHGQIQEAYIWAYLFRREAATNGQPNTNQWKMVVDDNNVGDTGTVNANWKSRYLSSSGGLNPVVNHKSGNGGVSYTKKWGENFLGIKLDCTKNEKGIRMTSFTTTPPPDNLDYEWALTLALYDFSQGCTATLNSVGANAMVYVHDANYEYDGTWESPTSPVIAPKFIFNSPNPIINPPYEYKTGMKDTSVNQGYTRATPYLNSIPFHLQDNRTRLEFDSIMYKVYDVGPLQGTQVIKFIELPIYQNFTNGQWTENQQTNFSINPNMSPGMIVRKVGNTKSPSDSVIVGNVNDLIFDPITGEVSTTSFRFDPTNTGSLAIGDIIIISQNTNLEGSLWARTKFGNSIRQLYSNSSCTIKWTPPVKDRFYVVKTDTSQNIKEVGVNKSLLLGEVLDKPLYCMRLNEEGSVVIMDAPYLLGSNPLTSAFYYTVNPTVKFSVQTCWDAGLFTDLESTFNHIYTPRQGWEEYAAVWTSKNYEGTEFRDGTLISHKPSFQEWSTTTEPAWCYYDNDLNNGPIYGKLYNWRAYTGRNFSQPYAVVNNIAPYGWRVPNPQEYFFLQAFLPYGAGLYISEEATRTHPEFWREIGTNHWDTDTSPNSNNISGFTALGSGFRDASNSVSDGFFYLKNQAYFGAQPQWYQFDINGTGPQDDTVSNICFHVNNSIAAEDYFGTSATSKRHGISLRFIKENMNTPGVYGRPLIQYLGSWDYTTVLDNG